jgi:MerR family transcriptional regulator, redox-sensitive transcriptional activator SoxR
MHALTIGEVARRVGIRQSAIRFYESAGLLPPSPRRGGRRCFDDGAVARLQVIRAARDLGFSLDDIRQLLREFPPDVPPPDRWRALARAKLPEVDEALRRLNALRRLLVAGMSCRCVTIDECFLDDCSSPGIVSLGAARRRDAVGAGSGHAS